jgi:hypothetical protein
MATPINITDVSADALRLKEMMDGVLERIQNVFQSYNVPLPSRQYWTMGTPAIDCEQLVVSFTQMYLGAPGDQTNGPQRCYVPRTATVEIMIAREVAVSGMNGRAPSAESIQKSSWMSAVDSWVLMDSLNSFDMWDETGYGLGVVATLETAGFEGGYNAVILQLTLAVP